MELTEGSTIGNYRIVFVRTACDGTREQIPVTSPVLNMTLRQALDSARQGQTVATAGRP